jgi:hypothetical protein
MLTPISDPVGDILDALEPDNVDGYTVSFGNAFTGLRCEGVFETLTEALAYQDTHANEHGESCIVTIWKPQA